ncbi:MAG: hypothetical protein ACR2PH_04940 [Desulfobulbia bacterium]
MKQYNACVAAILFSLMLMTEANGQGQSNCECILPIATIGKVKSINGVVRASTTSGLQPALVDTPLYKGSQLITGTVSSAAVEFSPSCLVSIGSNSELAVYELQNQLCVQVSRNPVRADLNPNQIFGPYPVIAGYAAFGIWALSGGDDQVSN